MILKTRSNITSFFVVTFFRFYLPVFTDLMKTFTFFETTHYTQYLQLSFEIFFE